MYLLTATAILFCEVLLVTSYCNNYFENKKYYISDDQRTWYSAKEECARRGMDLTSVCNSAEQTQLDGYVTSCSGTSSRYWIGLTNLAKDGYWRYQDGRYPDYTNYDWSIPAVPGQTEDCVSMQNTLTGADTWNQYSTCTNLYGYICRQRTC